MRPVDYSALTEKRCSKCRVVKPVSDFGTYADPAQPINGWRYYARCRDCARQAARDYGQADRARRNERLQRWRQRNPTAALANEQRKRLRHKYDLTPDQRDQMFAAQRLLCAICREQRPLVVDHDHETGRVRGGLCNRCNIVLGRVEADRSYAERCTLGTRMLTYLDQPCHADVLLELANAPLAVTG